MTSDSAHRAIALLAACAVGTVPAVMLAILGFDTAAAVSEPVSPMLSGTGLVTLLVVTRRRLRARVADVTESAPDL